MWEVFRDALVEVLSSLLSGLTGVGVGIIELFFQKKQILENEKRHQEILSNKIEKLTASLHESSQLMTEIEAEFEKQKQLAEKWQKQAATSQLIASLRKKLKQLAKFLEGNLKKKVGNRDEHLGGGALFSASSVLSEGTLLGSICYNGIVISKSKARH